MTESDRFWASYGHRLSNEYSRHIRSVSVHDDDPVVTIEWRGPVPDSLRRLIGDELSAATARLVQVNPGAHEYILRRLADRLEGCGIPSDVFESTIIHRMTGSLVMVLEPPVADWSLAAEETARIGSDYGLRIDLVTGRARSD